MDKLSYEFALALAVFVWAIALACLCLNIAVGNKGLTIFWGVLSTINTLTMLRAAYRLGKYG